MHARPASWPEWGLARGRAGRWSGRESSGDDGGYRSLVAPHRGHHLRHRWHCSPDQHPRPQCGRGGGSSRGPGSRVRRGGLRGAHVGTVLCLCSQGDQGANRGLCGQGRSRIGAG
ncbi:hypothetical protein G6F32_016503 [Rhizopus arrhizus]|nr:hypothetical protein G6F32_016503 [Rhizopus arrhizus]